MRYGEFHRIENNQAVESYIFLDIPELMIACKQWPLDVGPGHSRGYTGLIQGPASQDGVLKQETDLIEGQTSYQIVTNMLNQLATKDEAWRPYWHKNMMWYGPGAFGSFVGIDEFASFQVPFGSQFEGGQAEQKIMASPNILQGLVIVITPVQEDGLPLLASTLNLFWGRAQPMKEFS